MHSKHIKIYSGSSILINRLKSLLQDANITSIIKDNINSSQIAGFGPLGETIELLILNDDLDKANPIIEDFKTEINS